MTTWREFRCVFIDGTCDCFKVLFIW